MSLRFTHIFQALMAMAFLCAFALPARLTDLGRLNIEGFFNPVSRPTYHLANWVRGRVDEPHVVETGGTGGSEELRQENARLEQQILSMQTEISRLQTLAGERQSLGSLESLCDRVDVASADLEPRQGLMLDGNLAGVAEKQIVIFSGVLAGRIDRVGPGFAHVRLVTDPGRGASEPGFTVAGYFVRFVKTDSGIEPRRIGADLMPIVQGIGDGKMAIVNLPLEDVQRAGVAADDWIVLDDDAFPAVAKRLRIGKVASIGKYAKMPLFADIRLQPEPGLVRLTEVYVMVRDR